MFGVDNDVGENDGTVEMISHTTAQHDVIAIDHHHPNNSAVTYYPYERQSHHYDYEDGIALGVTFTETDYTFSEGFPVRKSTRVGSANRRLGEFSTETNALGDYRKDRYDSIRRTVDTQEVYTHYTSPNDCDSLSSLAGAHHRQWRSCVCAGPKTPGDRVHALASHHGHCHRNPLPGRPGP